MKMKNGSHRILSDIKNLLQAFSQFSGHDHNDFNDFTILCRDNDGSRLLIKESILISRDSHVLNKNTASIPLSLFD